MKKFFAVITVILSLTSGLALAQEGNFENDGTEYEGRIVVVTDSRGGTEVTYCDRNFLDYKAVVINPAGGPAIITTVAISTHEVVVAGDRFDIGKTATCEDRVSAPLARK